MQTQLPISEPPHHPAPEEIPRSRRVHVNRNLRFDLVSMVGFDMDYTLAIYRQAPMDRLSIDATAQKLVEEGYPSCLLDAPYRTDFPVRGLLIDRELGNIVKMDRYRYVKKAYRGMRELPREERRELYHSAKPIRVGSGRYHWVDTLYGLSEVAMFAGAIEMLDAENFEFEPGKLFDDIRRCIDLSHQDGSILNKILSDPAKYVVRDPELGATFHKLRSAGKKLFLLTNSRAAYTEEMMSFLLDGQLGGYSSWRSYFDIIITAAKKPSFFMDDCRPFEPAEDGLEAPDNGFERGRIYQHGCLEEFRRLVNASGDQVLYVGDHIYGDVLRAKKETAWRTAMIIQEMGREMEVHAEVGPLLERLDRIEALRDLLHEERRFRERELRTLAKDIERAKKNGADRQTLNEARSHHKKAIEKMKPRLRDLDRELETLEEEVDKAFHPFWGSIFKAGVEVSTFGDQVEQYACVYTDRVSNLLQYSPLHYFRSPRDRMPHELNRL